MRRGAAAYARLAVATGSSATQTWQFGSFGALAVCGSAPGPNHPADLRLLRRVLLPAELGPVQKALVLRAGERPSSMETVASPAGRAESRDVAGSGAEQ